PRALPPFPTRRSSDLPPLAVVPTRAMFCSGLTRLSAWKICCNGVATALMEGFLPPSTLAMLQSGVASALPGADCGVRSSVAWVRSEEHTSELQSRFDL